MMCVRDATPMDGRPDTDLTDSPTPQPPSTPNPQVLTPHCTRPYSEVAGFEHLLRYKTQNAGCCKILLHPRWGSSCYPATIFTTAPLPVLVTAMRRQEAEQAAAVLASVGQGQGQGQQQ